MIYIYYNWRSSLSFIRKFYQTLSYIQSIAVSSIGIGDSRIENISLHKSEVFSLIEIFEY